MMKYFLHQRPIENWDVSSIDDMSWLFYSKYHCNPNISDWNVSGVTDFSYMFHVARNFNQDIGGWNVSNGNDFVSDEHMYSMIDW